MNKRLLFILLIALISQFAWAQDDSSRRTDPKYIIDPETGKLSMVIRVWGEVKQPGVTMVPSDADLISLLSYVGGPTDRAKLENIRIIRFNEASGGERIVFADIEAFLETGYNKYLPKIYPNDTVIVKGTIWKIISSYSPFISLGISIFQAWYYFSIIQRSS